MTGAALLRVHRNGRMLFLILQMFGSTIMAGCAGKLFMFGSAVHCADIGMTCCTVGICCRSRVCAAKETEQ